MEEFEPKKKIKIIDKAFIAKYSYVLVLAVLLIGGISYGYTFFTENRKITSGSITTAALTINFTDRTINASNLSVPTNDQEGLSEFSKSLTITNQTTVDGRVKLTLTRTSGLELSDLRYALVINGAIQEIDDVPTNGVILESAIMGSEVIDVEIRLWPKTTYTGSTTTFVGELTPEIKYLGSKATTSISEPTGKYVNFNCSSTCEVWQIVKIESDRLVLTRQADYSGATSRVNSNRYDSSLTFNDNSMITSVSTDGKNVYLARAVKIDGGSGTQADPYVLVNNDSREQDKKVIAVITYKDNNNTTVGTQNVYYNETNYISQVLDDLDFQGWSDGTNDYILGDTINFTTDTILTAKLAQTLREKIMAKCNDSAITYVEKYDATTNGAAIDTPDGSGSEDVCFYTTTSTIRNSDAEQNANVIFGDYCWQIVRTTADGGVKLVYNGPKTLDNKCTSNGDTTNYSSNPRPSSIGLIGANGVEKKTVSGNKLYGTSFEIFDDNGTNKFRLKNTFTANWNGDYDNDGDLDYPKIIGNYVCGTSNSPTGTNSTCTVLYYVGHYQNETQASMEKYTIGTNSNYSQIGTSSFNAFYDSPALVGYMYNDVYNVKEKVMPKESYDVITRTSSPGAYYYGDTATWVTDHYELTKGGATPSVISTWSSVRSKAKGMYTCMSSTDTSCATVYYIVANSNDYNMYSVPLSNNEQAATKSVTWTIGTGYTGSNGNYSLTGTSTLTILLKDWYTTHNNSSYKDFYICDNKTSGTCTDEVDYVGATTIYQIAYNKITNPSYTFSNDVEYVSGEYKLIKTDPDNKPYQSIWDWYKNYNTISSTRYTCFENYDETNNTCGGTIYYVYYTNSTNAYYIELTNNEKVENALQKMLNTSNSNTSTVNKYNSAIKGVIDSWYESNLSSLSSFLDNDAVYCNDRSITALNGWSTNGSITGYLQFKYYDVPSKTSATLGCTNITDRFSKTNTKALLTYPIGLLSEAERAMMYSGFAKTGQYWWLGTPRYFSYYHATGRDVDNLGSSDTGYFVYYSFGVRPAVVLKPGIEIIDGNGTYNSPYVIDTSGN